MAPQVSDEMRARMVTSPIYRTRSIIVPTRSKIAPGVEVQRAGKRRVLFLSVSNRQRFNRQRRPSDLLTQCSMLSFVPPCRLVLSYHATVHIY